jgi:phospholipase C
MTYYTRRDIPFHYALADAFTICDSYHCSFLGSTDPNRYHMWTGWIGNDGRGGGPVIDNAEKGYGWTTYPERLERAGVSWKVYQDIGIGLDAAGGWGNTEDPCVGNYGDNSLLYFNQYRNSLPGQPLYEKARRGTNIAAPGSSFDALFDDLRKDVRENRLPQVSWIVAPEAFSEHGNWPANHGAWYISRVLDALTSNPESWSRTALFVTYDENDGFFDHVIPPTPPRWAADGGSTVDARQRDLSRGQGTSLRSLWPRRARAHDRGVAVEQGRLGMFRGLRSHLVDPVPGTPLRATPSRIDGAKHHEVAASHLR